MDKYRYILYMKQVTRKSLTSGGLKLESLPPTSAAAKYHSFKTYYAIQQWLGNDEVISTEWGCHFRNGMLHPIAIDQPVATEKVLLIVSCGCKTSCGKRCGCRKVGLFCTPMCSTCYRHTCSNICLDDIDNMQSGPD